MTENKYFAINLRDSKFGPKNAEQNNREKTIFFFKQQRKYYFFKPPINLYSLAVISSRDSIPYAVIQYIRRSSKVRKDAFIFISPYTAFIRAL